MRRRILISLISMLIGGWVFSSVVFASSIDVQFLPLRFFVNGEEKTTLPGQEAFILNGRTYVPLRFMAESLGCGVDWDRATSSIHITIDPDDIPNLPKAEEQKVSFTGIWRTESGSIYNLKQNGTSIIGTFTHYAEKTHSPDKLNSTDKPDDTARYYEYQLTGKVEDKSVELTWIYDDAEEYAKIKSVPLSVAQEVVGISETVSLTLDQETKVLEGYYFQDYVEWDKDTHLVSLKSDGKSQIALDKLPPLKIKLLFNNPI